MNSLPLVRSNGSALGCSRRSALHFLRKGWSNAKILKQIKEDVNGIGISSKNSYMSTNQGSKASSISQLNFLRMAATAEFLPERVKIISTGYQSNFGRPGHQQEDTCVSYMNRCADVHTEKIPPFNITLILKIREFYLFLTAVESILFQFGYPKKTLVEV